MGISFSCPFANLDDLNSRLESYLVRTISFGSDGRTALQPINFDNQIPEQSKMLRSLGSGKMIIEGTLSFKRRELEAKLALKSPVFDKEDKMMIRSERLRSRDETPDKLHSINSQIVPPEYGEHRDRAALKLQKTYKSFRTRRQLADCAVLVEQRWYGSSNTRA